MLDNLYIIAETYEISSYWSTEPIPNDPYSGYQVNELGLRIIGLYRAPPEGKMFYDTVKIDSELFKNDGLYVGVVRYSDGDTFSHTKGKYIFGSFAATLDEAQAELDNYLKNCEGYRYKPWEGYFASLDESYVEYVKFKGISYNAYLMIRANE